MTLRRTKGSRGRVRPRVSTAPGSPTRRLASRRSLLYTSFPGLCPNRRIHSDNCYLLNYLLAVRKRQSRWPSQPRPPPGSLVWSGGDTGSPGVGIRAQWPWGQLWCEWGHCHCSRCALCGPRPRQSPVRPSVHRGLRDRAVSAPPPSDPAAWAPRRVTALNLAGGLRVPVLPWARRAALWGAVPFLLEGGRFLPRKPRSGVASALILKNGSVSPTSGILK